MGLDNIWYPSPSALNYDKNNQQQILKQYGIVKEQLPKVRSSDPAVKVINGQPGQVVKVIRRSPTAGTATAYRLIVEAI